MSATSNNIDPKVSGSWTAATDTISQPGIRPEYVAKDFMVDFYAKKHAEAKRRAFLPNLIKTVCAIAAGAALMYGYMYATNILAPTSRFQSADEVHKVLMSHNYSYCPYCGEDIRKKESDFE